MWFYTIIKAIFFFILGIIGTIVPLVVCAFCLSKLGLSEYTVPVVLSLLVIKFTVFLVIYVRKTSEDIE